MSSFSGKPEVGNSVEAECIYEYIPFKLVAVLFLFCFLIFANTINQYFILDDFEHLYSIKYNSFLDVLSGFDTNLEGKFFRPIPMFLFWVQYKLFGPEPIVFHATTLLLHAFTAVLATNLFYLFFKNLRLAAIFGFVFIAFPNHSEVVNWPAINFTSGATVFFLAALILFGYYRLSSKIPFFIASMLSFLAATLSNEQAFVFPVLLVVFDLLFSRARQVRVRLSGRVIDHCVCFGSLFIMLVVTRRLLNLGIGYRTVDGSNLVSLYLNDIWLLATDLIRMNLTAWKFLLAPISPDFSFQKQLISAILLIWAGAGIVLVYKRRINLIALLFCFCFVSITLLPALGTFKVLKITYAVRHIYFPSIGSCFIIALLLDGMSSCMKKAQARYAFLALTLIPMLYLTKFYDGKWIDAQKENKRVMEAIAGEICELPQPSRVYVSGIPWSRNEIPLIDYAFPSASGLYCDKRETEAALDSLPTNKILELNREQYAERDWRYFLVKWDGESQTSGVEEIVQLTPDSGAPPLTLDLAQIRFRRELEPTNDLDNVFASGFPYPIFSVRGGWAMLKLPRLAPGPPVKYLTIEMMLKGEKAREDISRIFWVTEDDLDYTGEKSIAFNVVADGRFHDYKIPLYRNGLTLTGSSIRRFAIRPSQTPGTIFSLRKMVLEYY